MRIIVLAITFFLSILSVGDAAAERFALQAGTQWETYGCIADSGQAGPTVLILGGVHGNGLSSKTYHAAYGCTGSS